MLEKLFFSSLTNWLTKAADNVWQAGKGYFMESEPSWQKGLNVNPIPQTDTRQNEPLPSLLSTLQQGVTWLYHHPKQIMMLTGLALAYSASQEEQRADNISSQREVNGETYVPSHQVWRTLIPSPAQMVDHMAVFFSVGILNHPDRYSQGAAFLTPLNLMTLSSFLPMINAQVTENAFLKIFGGNFSDYGRALTTTPTGEVVVAGYTTSFGAGGDDVLVAKFFENGTLVWARTLGGSSSDYGRALTTTPTGEIVVAGYTRSFGAGGSDILLAKLLANGTLVWARTLGGSNSDEGYALTTTPTGEIVVAGYTASFGAGNYDVLVTKLLADGTLAWARTLGGTNFDYGRALTTTATGEIVVVGYIDSFGAGSRDVLVAKLFANGTLAWPRTLGGSRIDVGNALTTTATGEIVVAGYTTSFGAGSRDVLVAKLFANGTLAWARTLGGSNSDEGLALTTTPTGEIVVTGYTTSFGAGNRDVLVAKFLANGTLVWARTLGGSNNDDGLALTTTSAGEIVVAGDTFSFGAGLNDFFLAKLNSNGTVPGCANIRTLRPTVLSWSNISNTVIMPTFTSLSTTGSPPTRISIQDWTTISAQFITPQALRLCFFVGNLSMGTQSGAATSAPIGSSSPTVPTSNNPSGTSQITARFSPPTSLAPTSPTPTPTPTPTLTPTSSTSVPLPPVGSPSLMGTPVSSRPVVTTNNPSNSLASTPVTQTKVPFPKSLATKTSLSPAPKLSV